MAKSRKISNQIQLTRSVLLSATVNHPLKKFPFFTRKDIGFPSFFEPSPFEMRKAPSSELRNASNATFRHSRGLGARSQSRNWDHWTWSRESRNVPTWKRRWKRASSAFKTTTLASAFWLWKRTEWNTFALPVVPG